MAFVAATPVLLSRTSTISTSPVFSARKAVAQTRRAKVSMVGNRPNLEKIPQGFTAFSEQLNGRAAMIGFALAVITEAITGKGIIGQVGSIFDIIHLASALGN